MVSFDNHPDWDIRPPRWACGSWVNRALELPQIEKLSVWGCGNFECWWPRRIFGNNRAERIGRLEVHPWADDRAAKDRGRRGAMLRANWREQFAAFAEQLGRANVYLTVDLDCLRSQDAITNWESGRFTIEESHGQSSCSDAAVGWSGATFAERGRRRFMHGASNGLPPRWITRSCRSAIRKSLGKLTCVRCKGCSHPSGNARAIRD